ncbi:MAG: Npt1/Npt2 family nucleotide transporter [Vicinamibacterales bacterium]
MVRVLARALDLSDDELRRSWPVCAYLFLTMSGTVASKATRDALFLDRYRAIDLPYVDIAIAVLVGLAVSLYIRTSRWVPLRTLQIGSLLFFALNCLGFYWLSQFGVGGGALFVTIYLWVGLFSVLAPAQVWTLANFVLTTREAKRAFGFIGSGAILGWIVGGFATRVTAEWLGTETLLLWVAVSLVLSAGLVHLAWQRAAPPAVDTRMQALGIRASLRQIAESPYLQSIAAVVGLAAFATTIGGWQFKALAKAHVPDTDQLAAFFGSFNMAAGAASLVLQLVLTGRVLRAFGVGVALFVVPVAMASASLGVILFGTLAAASALKASDQVLRYSIDKATVELLYLPLSAAETFRVKSFIDTVVYRLGDGLGGLAVLACAAWLGWNPMQVGWLTLAAVVAWMVAAGAARSRYVSNLQESIRQHRVDAERAHAPMLDRDATEALAGKLRGDTADILYALSLFEASKLRTVHPVVPSLLAHASADVRVRAVALLSHASVLSVRREVEALLRDPHLEVRTEALLYMTRHANVDPLTVIESLGDFPDFSIRASMIAFLARPGRAQNLDAAQLMLQRMVAEGGDEGIRSRVEAARVIGLVPDAFDRELRKLLEDEAPEVAREAVRAAGLLGKRQLAHRLIDRIAEPWLTDAVVEALARLGDRVVGTIRDQLVDADTPVAVRRELPAALQAIGSPAAQHVLAENILDRDTVVRTRVLAALNKLVQLHPGRRLDRQIVETALAAEITGHYRSYQMLETIGGTLVSAEPVVLTLRESLDGESERIFRLLKILYPEHDLHSAFVGIQSADPAVHDNALEFLDNILAPHVRALVVPLFDRAITAETRARAADRLVGVAVGTRDEAIAVMARSRDPWLQSCAAYAIGELRLAAFAETVDRWSADPDPLLRATALAARAKLKDRAAVPAVDVG